MQSNYQNDLFAGTEFVRPHTGRERSRISLEFPVVEEVLIVDATGEISSAIRQRASDSQANVVRVRCANDAYLLVRHSSQFTAVVHPELPDESGWLVAAKLRLTSPNSHIWMYGSSIALPEEHLAAVGATGCVDATTVRAVLDTSPCEESEAPPPKNLIPRRRSICPQDSSVLLSSSR